MTELICVGLNHHSAPVTIRERVAFQAADLPAELALLRAIPGVAEAVILSTCNRVELYAAVSGAEVAAAITHHLHTRRGLAPETLTPHLFTHVGDDAARHLFRVASSLDAVVVGEPQILGQVKEAFRAAAEAGQAGTLVSRLFQRAFAVAKRVRTETGIAQNAVSVSFAAVELAKSLFGALRGRVCLLVGAGNMGELAARHFAQEGASLWVVNRSFERAQSLATAFGGSAHSFEDLSLLLEKADVVLTSTAAQDHIISREMMKPIMRARRWEPLFLIDIAVPRNVDPEVTQLENVYAYDVDDLARVVDENKGKRQQEAERAELLVNAEVRAWREWWVSLEVVPIIKALRARATALVEAEVRKALGGLAEGAPESERAVVRAACHAVVNKLLHDPLTALKAAQPEGSDLAAAARRLFNLDADALDQQRTVAPASQGGLTADAAAALREAEAAEATPSRSQAA